MIQIPTNYEEAVQLQQFACELNLQNETLKKHILKLQHCIQLDRRNFNDQIEKLKLYTEQCQHQIKKREERELYLMQVTQDLEHQKQNQVLQRKDLEKQMEKQRLILLTQRQRLVETIQKMQNQNLQINKEKKYLINNFEEYKIVEQEKRLAILQELTQRKKLIKQAEIQIKRQEQIIKMYQNNLKNSYSKNNQFPPENNQKLQKKLSLPEEPQIHKIKQPQKQQKYVKSPNQIKLQATVQEQKQTILNLTKDVDCLLNLIASQSY